MNKLVIVGNGFDLAHDLPTSYTHFINHFWKLLKNRQENDTISKMVSINVEFEYSIIGGRTPSSYKNFLEIVKISPNRYDIDDRNKLVIKDAFRNVVFQFLNTFLENIIKQSIENWVDIENIYYGILKDLVTGKNDTYYNKYQGSIETLNKEFEEVKILLEEYLKNEVLDRYDFDLAPQNSNEIFDFFKILPNSLLAKKDHNYFNEFPHSDRDELIKIDNEIIKLQKDPFYYSELIGQNIQWPLELLFLDFNYTETVRNYIDQIRNINVLWNATHIQIHGKINSKENKVNFGFGDEMDDEYKIIENANDNRYLNNIKSFQYLHTSNYRKLLNWIESNKFQVYIFGHSCGLSDRTLLNTIFENDNCRSIKIFYHKTGETTDNYTELTQNISRHFNKKALMRTKIVDKTLCQELPQTIRFKEKKNI